MSQTIPNLEKPTHHHTFKNASGQVVHSGGETEAQHEMHRHKGLLFAKDGTNHTHGIAGRIGEESSGPI